MPPWSPVPRTAAGRPDDGTGWVPDLPGVCHAAGGGEDESTRPVPDVGHPWSPAPCDVPSPLPWPPCSSSWPSRQGRWPLPRPPRWSSWWDRWGSSNAHYKADAEAIAVEALRRYTSNVVKLDVADGHVDAGEGRRPGRVGARLPRSRQRLAQHVRPVPGADQGRPGAGSSTGAGRTKTVYYGEDYILGPTSGWRRTPSSSSTTSVTPRGTRSRASPPARSPAPASAWTTTARGSSAPARARSSPKATQSTGPPTTCASCSPPTGPWTKVFRAAPSRHGNVIGRTRRSAPGLRFRMDPDCHAVGLLPVGHRGPGPDRRHRRSWGGARADGETTADFVLPGAAEVRPGRHGPLRVPGGRRRSGGRSVSTLAKGTRLRLATEGAAMPDGTRVFGVSVLGGSVSGFVRATELAPRDSVAPEVWTSRPEPRRPSAQRRREERRPGRGRAPFGDGRRPASRSKNAAGTSVWSGERQRGHRPVCLEPADKAGALVPDGAYAWTMKSRDTRGNADRDPDRGLHGGWPGARHHRLVGGHRRSDGWTTTTPR